MEYTQAHRLTDIQTHTHTSINRVRIRIKINLWRWWWIARCQWHSNCQLPRASVTLLIASILYIDRISRNRRRRLFCHPSTFRVACFFFALRFVLFISNVALFFHNIAHFTAQADVFTLCVSVCVLCVCMWHYLFFPFSVASHSSAIK